MLDQTGGVAFRPSDRHDIEPRSRFEQPMPFEEMEGGQREPLLFPAIDRFRRVASLSGLDLDEHNDVTFATDQVNFAMRGPVASDQDFKATTPEKIRRCAFPPIAQPATPETSDNRGFRRTRITHRSAPHAERSLDLGSFRTPPARQVTRFKKPFGPTRNTLIRVVASITDRRATPGGRVFRGLGPDGLLVTGVTPDKRTNHQRQPEISLFPGRHAAPPSRLTKLLSVEHAPAQKIR